MKLHEKSHHINTLLNDILAEYLISSIIDEGLNINDVLVYYDGHLKRNWAKDIALAEINKYEIGNETLEVHVNRTGLYDGLPEAFFHAFGPDKNSTGTEMAKDSVRLKMEEKEARLFFRPFENEIFLKGVQLVTCENEAQYSIFANFINGLIPRFWKIDPKIPEELASKLESLLPYADEITGNTELMAQSLEFILNEKVVIHYTTQEPQEKTINYVHSGFSLGAGSLGRNMILGAKSFGFVGRYIIQIGPLENHEPEYFFCNAPADRIIKSFSSFFTPVETDTETVLLMNDVKSQFLLSDTEGIEKSYLGYNSVL